LSVLRVIRLLAVDLDVRSLGRYRRRQLAGLILEFGGGLDQPGRHIAIRGRFRHFQQLRLPDGRGSGLRTRYNPSFFRGGRRFWRAGYRGGVGAGPGISILGGGSLGVTVAPASFAAWNVVPGGAAWRWAAGPFSYQNTRPPTAARPSAAVTSTGQWRCSGGFRRGMYDKTQQAEMVPCAALRRARRSGCFPDRACSARLPCSLMRVGAQVLEELFHLARQRLGGGRELA
jgi:hypothetical protein